MDPVGADGVLFADRNKDDLALGIKLPYLFRNLDPCRMFHIDIKENQVIGGIPHGLEE